MKHPGLKISRLAKKAWTLGWGLLFVCMMTGLSLVGAGYSDHFAVAKSMVSPAGASAATQR